ncbi:RNA polymerase sigma factor [Catenuloplanes japonicus]|uniref:RNA polymerase sigma factor n=1 Tax=Catenuloplanes japonicus TaxID=33876 RepID=UPI0006914FCC|nr:RNA polymerase sigma factor [Catenuloplanes japonicus]
MIPDDELARAAAAGDVPAFALLTARHRAGMRATAIALLGYTDEVDDAVQDAVLTAFRRLPTLRDPGSAGPWLRAIVRNVCRTQLRARRPIPVAEPELYLPAAAEPRPDEMLDTADARDWVRHAVGRLSAPIREVVLLRYFSGFSSYHQIAQLCGIGVDTVGSRLRDGRRILARTLRDTAGEAYRTADAEAETHWALARQHFTTIHRGGYASVIEDWYRPDFSVMFLGALTGDRTAFGTLIDWTMEAGVVGTLRDVAGSDDVLVWEGAFHNPPESPDHCPPTFAWMLRLREGRVARIGVAYGV